MTLRRVGRSVPALVAILLWMACGQVYRPVVIPLSTTPPNPANFHAAFSVNSNGSYDAANTTFSFGVGTAFQIDVAGDTNIGQGNVGINPTHAAIFPNHSRVFVTSAGSVEPGGFDIISAFTPASQFTEGASLGAFTTFSLPNVINPTEAATILAITESGTTVTVTLNASLPGASVGQQIVIAGVPVAGYDGEFTISSVGGNVIQYADPATGLVASSGGSASVAPLFFCKYLPDFVTASQNANVYVANYGVENDAACNVPSTDSIAVLSSGLNAITNIVYLPAGSHPITMAEVLSPNGDKLYVGNQGTNSIMSFNTVDMSTNPVTGFTGTTPAWMVGRADGQKVYVVTQGDGNLFTIDTATDTVTSTLPVGAGANYVFYDPKLSRLYVTNPNNGTLYIFATSFLNSAGQPVDTPQQLAAIPIPGVTGCAGCTAPSPVSVTALLDGSRAYVASYQLQSCSDPTFSASCLIYPQVTVIDATSNTIQTTLSPLASVPGGTATPSASESIDCIPSIPYSSAGIALGAGAVRFSTRFRMSTASSADSTRVYVGMCDAGSVAIIQTQTNSVTVSGNDVDTLITDMPAPFANGFPGVNNLPPQQNPVWLFPGQ